MTVKQHKQKGAILFIFALVLTFTSATLIYSLTGKSAQQMKSDNSQQKMNQLNQVKERLKLFASEHNSSLFCSNDLQGHLPELLENNLGFDDLINLDKIEIIYEADYNNATSAACSPANYDVLYVCDTSITEPLVATLKFKNDNLDEDPRLPSVKIYRQFICP